jgi:hypothetical protein
MERLEKAMLVAVALAPQNSSRRAGKARQREMRSSDLPTCWQAKNNVNCAAIWLNFDG